MAASIEHLQSKILDCKQRLEEAQKKSASVFKVVSLTQSRAIEDLLVRSNISSEKCHQERAEIMSLLSDCPFASGDFEQLCRCMERETPTPRPSKKGQKLGQEYINFIPYMSEECQKQFLSDDLEASAKQELLFDFMECLGLVRGDEHTYKMMASFLLAHTEEPRRIEQMTPKTKWLLKNNLRDNWLKRPVPHPPSLCTKLPSDTGVFRAVHPQLYEAALGSSPPLVQPLVKKDLALEIDSTYSARNEGQSGTLGKSKTSALQLQQPQAQPTDQLQNILVPLLQAAFSNRFTDPGYNLTFLKGSQTDTREMPDIRRLGMDLPRHRMRPNLRTPTLEDQDDSRMRPNLGALALEDQNDSRVRPNLSTPALENQNSSRMMPVEDQSNLEPSSMPAGRVQTSTQLAPRPAHNGEGRPKPTVASIMLALHERKNAAAKRKQSSPAAQASEAQQLSDQSKQSGLAAQTSEAQQLSKPHKANSADQRRLENKRNFLAMLDLSGDNVITPNKKHKSTVPTPTKDGVTSALDHLVRVGKPSISHEKSRGQFLVRTGFRGRGQSTKFEYGSGKDYCDIHEAKNAATCLLAEHMKNQGFDAA